jgi:hypothetical protein
MNATWIYSIVTVADGFPAGASWADAGTPNGAKAEANIRKKRTAPEGSAQLLNINCPLSKHDAPASADWTRRLSPPDTRSRAALEGARREGRRSSAGRDAAFGEHRRRPGLFVRGREGGVRWRAPTLSGHKLGTKRRPRRLGVQHIDFIGAPVGTKMRTSMLLKYKRNFWHP